MLTLRWILGLILVVCAGGFVALNIIGGGFRRSFGASDTNPLLFILPMLALALMFIALVAPASKPLLHAAAVAAGVLAAFCVWAIFAQNAREMWFAVGYLGLWFLFYYRALQ
jgi:hypothetical protein